MEVNAEKNLNKENDKSIENNEYQNKLKYKMENSTFHAKDNNIQIYLECKGTIQIFLSELGFIVLSIIILIILLLIPEYHTKNTYTSKEKIVFNQDPIILLHTTDTHINFKKNERTESTYEFMLSLIEYNPNLVLLTGDYVDNFDKKRRMGLQNLEDWKIYNSTIRDLFFQKGFKVIDISGNHDQWAVDEANSKENNFLDYSFAFNRSNTKS